MSCVLLFLGTQPQVWWSWQSRDKRTLHTQWQSPPLTGWKGHMYPPMASKEGRGWGQQGPSNLFSSSLLFHWLSRTRQPNCEGDRINTENQKKTAEREYSVAQWCIIQSTFHCAKNLIEFKTNEEWKELFGVFTRFTCYSVEKIETWTKTYHSVLRYYNNSNSFCWLMWLYMAPCQKSHSETSVPFILLIIVHVYNTELFHLLISSVPVWRMMMY